MAFFDSPYLFELEKHANKITLTPSTLICDIDIEKEIESRLEFF